MRKIRYLNDKIQCFMVKGKRNPCGCGSSLYHQELEGDRVIGVCNACGEDIYEIGNMMQTKIKTLDWRDN